VAAHQEEPERPFGALVDAARASGAFSLPRDRIGMYETTEPGVWRINTTRLQRLDGTNVEDLTAAEVQGRRQVHELMRFFRALVPGYERAVLLDTAAQVGVRETRRIVGEYVLRLADLQSGEPFEDTIGLCGYPVDLHSPTDTTGGASAAHATANAYHLPYRSLVPLGVERLLVAGRCLSATHEAAAAVRVMPPCFAMGQAAGTAAAMACRDGSPLRRVSARALQRQLAADGVYLGEEWHATYGPPGRAPAADEGARPGTGGAGG
jgi:hypothetical protein